MQIVVLEVKKRGIRILLSLTTACRLPLKMGLEKQAFCPSYSERSKCVSMVTDYNTTVKNSGVLP